MVKTVIIYLFFLLDTQITPVYAISAESESLTQKRVNDHMVNLYYSHEGREEIFEILEDYGQIPSKNLDTLELISVERLRKIEIDTHKQAIEKAADTGSLLIPSREKMFPVLYLVENRNDKCHLYRVKWYETID
ncbi:hypothetical protein AB9P05_22230 [Roseivirga sp. BDSF3-8]|uniref:hypothetical protein n=1 Tax=Roseivirga sp. BDSF3-8 TaxID=3241598 RepID=UPI003531C508